MLDQNTDRMWFVIGAVIVGAAIIFIANGTLPDLFASVGGTFENTLNKTLYIDESFEAFGESRQLGDPGPNNRVDVTGISSIPAGMGGVQLSTELHGLGEHRDRLYYDSTSQLWKVDRHVGHMELNGSTPITKNGFGAPYTAEQNRKAQLYVLHRSNVPNIFGASKVMFSHAPERSALPYDRTVSNTSNVFAVVYFNVELDPTSDTDEMSEWLEEHRPVLTYVFKNPVTEVLGSEDQKAMNEILQSEKSN